MPEACAGGAHAPVIRYPAGLGQADASAGSIPVLPVSNAGWGRGGSAVQVLCPQLGVPHQLLGIFVASYQHHLRDAVPARLDKAADGFVP